ncbi:MULTISPECIES: DUF6169 family protein [unclassified Spirosoma]|uniref:DUF6169 family protein n=1 Tax=unclassified Spirosoma TaxID=2621999 RepID=UPI00095C6B7C|nr:MULTISPECIES: DUF6169 family protein [unclassified Spirosoma]MBN8821050.1 hypothetical protein [Spirosoma sp.]OJW79309.1 MAG: hypothetical protein BGO59_12275 [Spirosoma sp. 48-14]
MQKQEHQSLGYQFTHEQENTFLFRTSNRILYEVRFKPSGYIFANDPALEPFVFEISIVVIDNPTGNRPPGDPLVPPTIHSIFRVFFEQHERSVVYICDTSDKRGQARQRKFSSWLTLYGGRTYVQFNDSLLDDSGEVYFVSLISKSTNPFRQRLIRAFHELITVNQREK